MPAALWRCLLTVLQVRKNLFCQHFADIGLVDPSFSLKFREKWINNEMVDLLLQYAKIVDSEGQILLSFLFCLILEGPHHHLTDNMERILGQVEQSTASVKAVFPTRFCSYIWMDVSIAQNMTRSPYSEVQKWSYAFLEASAKTSK